MSRIEQLSFSRLLCFTGQLRHFVKRHRALFTALTILVVLVAGSTGIVVWRSLWDSAEVIAAAKEAVDTIGQDV